MRHINVIGSSCAGKSTFAGRLAAAIGVPHVELDALYWEPGWVEVAIDVFRNRVTAATLGDGWVIDGNYGLARDIVWGRADTIIWLDYPFALVLRQAMRRTMRRLFSAEPCCNGNRESLGQIFSRDSILLWVVQTHARRRREFRQLLPTLHSRGIKVMILCSPPATERWLRTLSR